MVAFETLSLFSGVSLFQRSANYLSTYQHAVGTVLVALFISQVRPHLGEGCRHVQVGSH